MCIFLVIFVTQFPVKCQTYNYACHSINKSQGHVWYEFKAVVSVTLKNAIISHVNCKTRITPVPIHHDIRKYIDKTHILNVGIGLRYVVTVRFQ